MSLTGLMVWEAPFILTIIFCVAAGTGIIDPDFDYFSVLPIFLLGSLSLSFLINALLFTAQKMDVALQSKAEVFVALFSLIALWLAVITGGLSW